MSSQRTTTHQQPPAIRRSVIGATAPTYPVGVSASSCLTSFFRGLPGPFAHQDQPPCGHLVVSPGDRQVRRTPSLSEVIRPARYRLSNSTGSSPRFQIDPQIDVPRLNYSDARLAVFIPSCAAWRTLRGGSPGCKSTKLNVDARHSPTSCRRALTWACVRSGPRVARQERRRRAPKR